MLEWIEGRWHLDGKPIHAGCFMWLRIEGPQERAMQVRIESQEHGKRLVAYGEHGWHRDVTRWDMLAWDFSFFAENWPGCEAVKLEHVRVGHPSAGSDRGKEAIEAIRRAAKLGMMIDRELKHTEAIGLGATRDKAAQLSFELGMALGHLADLGFRWGEADDAR